MTKESLEKVRGRENPCNLEINFENKDNKDDKLLLGKTPKRS